MRSKARPVATRSSSRLRRSFPTLSLTLLALRRRILPLLTVGTLLAAPAAALAAPGEGSSASTRDGSAVSARDDSATSAQEGGAAPRGSPSQQVLDRRAEVYVRIGYGNLYNDEGSLGTGPGVAGGFVWRLSERLGAGVEVERMQNERAPFAGGSIEGDGFIGTGNLYLYLLTDAPHQFYLSGGLGAVGYERRQVDLRTDVEGNVTEVFLEDSETTLGVRGAAGARINARPDLVIRLEASLFWAETEIVEAPFAWLQGSISFGYRF